MSLTFSSFAETQFQPKFYAFLNGLDYSTLAEETSELKQMGYDGVSQIIGGGLNQLQERVEAYNKEGLEVLSVYLNVNDKPLTPEIMGHLISPDAMVELTIMKLSEKTVSAVYETAEIAQSMNIKVALYPHQGFSIATMPQALELIKKVNHPNLGVMFNLCHFLKSEDETTLEQVLQTAAPHLFAVSINGADTTGTTWDDFIKPLGRGNFPQKRLFKALKEINFQGPVGLQCYGTTGDKKENLQTSITAWEAILKTL